MRKISNLSSLRAVRNKFSKTTIFVVVSPFCSEETQYIVVYNEKHIDVLLILFNKLDIHVIFEIESRLMPL